MKTKRVWTWIALGHLALAGLGAASLDFSGWGKVGTAIEGYMTLSGADSGYGFFAPGVGGQLRARFEVVDAKGKVTQVPLETPSTHEAALRVGNIIDQFWNDEDDDDSDEEVKSAKDVKAVADDEEEDDDEGMSELHRSLLASLAGKVFARHPEARQVMVRLDEFYPVSMADFRKGERPRWQEFYEARFAYRAPFNPPARSDLRHLAAPLGARVAVWPVAPP
jgi:hypothetical protein